MTPHKLQYAASRRWRHGRIGLVVALALSASAWVAWRQWPGRAEFVRRVECQAQFFVAERRCASWDFRPADLITRVDQLTRVDQRSVSATPSPTSALAWPQFVRWEEARVLEPIAVEPSDGMAPALWPVSPLVYMHSRRNLAGTRLVTVEAQGPGFLTLHAEVFEHTWFRPGRCLSTVSIDLVRMDLKNPLPPTLDVYGGQTDPRDTSLFHIPYVYGAERGTIDGHLEDDDTIQFIVRAGADADFWYRRRRGDPDFAHRFSGQDCVLLPTDN